jgi:hypothetical protein
MRAKGEGPMIEASGEQFQALCAEPAVRERIATLADARGAGIATFWKRLALTVLLAVAATWAVVAIGWEAFSIIVAILILCVGFIVALQPLLQVGQGLKHPVLEAAAAQAGMDYVAADFTPPAFHSARNLWFGSASATETFTDLFNGKDEDGFGYAVYEASLTRSSGKSTQTVFSGQVYAIQTRPRAGHGVTVAVPDKGMFNFWKPARGMERVSVPSDEAFEKRFEIYSEDPMGATSLLFDSSLRALLHELRSTGAVWLYVGPEEALVAVAGKNRFEPGSMFRSKGGEERARTMYDDVCAALKTLDAVKARLG